MILINNINIHITNKELIERHFCSLEDELRADLEEVNFENFNPEDIIYLESGFSIHLGHNLKIVAKEDNNIYCELIEF